MSERIFEALLRSDLESVYTTQELREAAAAAASCLKDASRHRVALTR